MNESEIELYAEEPTTDMSVNVTIDSGIEKIVMTNADWDINTTITANGDYITYNNSTTTFVVTLKDGYEMDTVLYAETPVEPSSENTYNVRFNEGSYSISFTSKQATAKKEIWLLNYSLTSVLAETAIEFFCLYEGGFVLNRIKCEQTDDQLILYYGYYQEEEETTWLKIYDSYSTYASNGLRFLVLQTSATGDFLTWLQANAVKQGDTITLPAGRYQWTDVAYSIESGLDLPEEITFNFESKNISYSKMVLEYNSGDVSILKYDSTTVYQDGDWTYNDYKIIETETAQQIPISFYILFIASTKLDRQYLLQHGIYNWVDSPDLSFTPQFDFSVQFDYFSAFVFSNGKRLTQIVISNVDSSNQITYFERETSNEIVVYNGETWTDNAYKTFINKSDIYIGSDIYYYWFILSSVSKKDVQLSYDLSQNSKWANLGNGNHTIRMKAKATGYEDSDLSTSYTFTKVSTYNIYNALTNLISNDDNPTTIKSNETITLLFEEKNNYKFPDTITVTNANYTWDKSTGKVVLSNATGDVTITMVGALDVVTLEAGTYKWIDEPKARTTAFKQPIFDFEFKTNNRQGYYMEFNSGTGAITFIYYSFVKVGATGARVYDSLLTNKWSNEAYKTILIENNQQIDSVLYDYLITNGNLVKQVTSHTLTFDSTQVTVTVNGASATSPYTLQNGDTIVARGVTITPENGIYVNNIELTYEQSQGYSISNSDVLIEYKASTSGDIPATHATINYTE